jgi:quercetin dioxygenase-like cupin family protein
VLARIQSSNPNYKVVTAKPSQKESFEMSIDLQTNTQPSRIAPELFSTPNGTLFEILASPKEVADEICLIRGTMPPGVKVPLHSHADLEVFYVLEGSLEIFQSKEGASGWTTVGVGAVAAIPGNVKHALRNTSSLPATIVLVTTSKMYRFFREVSKPFDPTRRPDPPTPEEMKTFFAIVSRYGYWMASLEGNAAVGIFLGR